MEGEENSRRTLACPLGQTAGPSASLNDLLTSKCAPHTEQTKEYKGMLTSANPATTQPCRAEKGIFWLLREQSACNTQKSRLKPRLRNTHIYTSPGFDLHK
jgi:hypothetical protein